MIYWIMIADICLISLFFLCIGIKALASKRALILHARYFFILIIAGFSPMLLNSLHLLTKSSSDATSVALIINPILFIIMLIVFWIQMKGYILIGIRDESFREALHFSLNKNNLPFEERLSVIALTEHQADLQVSIQAWVGSGQIKLKKSKDKQLLKTVINGINEYYLQNRVPRNILIPVIYLVLGILMMISTGVLAVAILT